MLEGHPKMGIPLMCASFSMRPTDFNKLESNFKFQQSGVKKVKKNMHKMEGHPILGLPLMCIVFSC